MKRRKKEPVGCIGPSKGRGPGTSLGKGGWRVTDSTGQWIAAGFTSQAYALRWIDGFNLMRAGSQLSDDDLRWIYLHWYLARPERLDPKPRAPTESSKTNVPTSKGLKRKRSARWRLAQQIQAPVTHKTWCHETRQSRGGETGRENGTTSRLQQPRKCCGGRCCEAPLKGA